jgi:hypothetical protein
LAATIIVLFFSFAMDYILKYNVLLGTIKKAVWALGNVAGDSPKCRDLVLANGALLPLLAQLNEHAKLSMLRNATWTLSNFCRGKPQPSFDQVLDKACLFFCSLHRQLLLSLVLFQWNRQSQRCQRLLDLFIPMMRKFSLMHAGLFHTYLMALMIRSKLSLKLVFVLGLWSSSCM